MKIETKNIEENIRVKINFEDDNSIQRAMGTLIAINEAAVTEMSRNASKLPEATKFGLDEEQLCKKLYLDLSKVFLSMARKEV